MLFEIELNNPTRRLHIEASNKEEAEKILSSMGEVSGITEETEILTFKEITVANNIKEPEFSPYDSESESESESESKAE